jgi:glutamate-1-semialdehyde 2,1-aminomutase
MSELGYPLYARKADGARFTDVDGNEYVDYLMGFGPIVLGHNDPAVRGAVRKQMDEGTVYSLCHPLELEVANLLIDTIPAAEMVGFFIGGSGATSGAVRIARGYTGRDAVIKCGYHGWHDWTRPGDPGVPGVINELTSVVNYGDLFHLDHQLSQNAGHVACIIVETIQGEGSPDGYLQGCVDLAHKHGALCVFDETKVGFRLAFGGSGEHFGVTPDLSTFGKAISNGYPGSFVSGKKEILGSESTRSLWMTATFQSDILSLAAIQTTISELKRRDGIAYQWRLGEKLMSGINEVFGQAGLSFKLVGYGPMPTPSVDDADRDRCNDVLRRCLAKGHYLHPTHPWFLSLAHTDDDIDKTIGSVEEAIGET